VAAWIVWPVFSSSAAPAGFERIGGVAELDERLRAPGKPVMLDFYADWCVSCKEMESFTFSDPRVRAELDKIVLLQADVTANRDEHKALLKRFALFGPPGIIFFDARGREIPGLRVIGYQNSERFLKTLSRATAP
jgi:thiol:disulfide interchange protein DsbD